MIRIDSNLLERTTDEAKMLPRKRKNFNFHETLDANVQRMLNALEPGTYVQPHKHEDPDKFEAFIVLTGTLLVVEFDNNGAIADYCILSPKKGNFGIELKPRTWHTIAALETGTVIYEVKDGPYSALNDKNFATWAPAEGDAKCTEYLNSILEKCK